MSDFDTDIEALLADVLEGKDPALNALDNPPPLEPPPEEKPEVLSPEPDDEIPSIDDILAADYDPDPSIDEVDPAPELHACKEEDEPCDSSDANDSPNVSGTDEAVSATPAASDASDAAVDGSTGTDSTDSSTQSQDVSTESTDDVAEADLDPVDESQWSKEVPVEPIQLPDFTSDELMEDLDIRNYGTLVALNTLRWHAKVRDHKAAADAAGASGADKSAFEARKRLLVGADEKLKRVHTAIDAARTEHYRMTLPWSTVGVNDHGKRAGPRLLPNTLFFEYTQKMGKFKQEMVTALDEFVQAYPTLIAIAQKKLGGAFNASEYPPPSAIRQHFGLAFDFLPIPTGADFDNVTLQQAEKLALNVNRKTRQMLENAMQDAWKRLQDDMQHAYNALSNPNAKFHYTLIDKMKEHASMLTHLNVTKDPRIEAIRQRIDKDLATRDVKEVRKDDALRAHMADEAKAVLTLMEAYTNDSKGTTDGN